MQTIYDLIKSFFDGIVALLSSFGLWLIEKIIIFGLQIIEFFITEGSQLVDSYFTNSAIFSDFVNSYLALSETSRSILSAMQVPTAVSIILAAYALRVGMRFIPFYK